MSSIRIQKATKLAETQKRFVNARKHSRIYIFHDMFLKNKESKVVCFNDNGNMDFLHKYQKIGQS